MKLFLIIFAIGLVIGGGIICKNNFLNTNKNSNLFKDVKGTETSNIKPTPSSSNTNTYIQSAISQIKEQAQNINLAQVASSSPQIQSIIEQIQNLPQVPINDAKQACIQVCNKL